MSTYNPQGKPHLFLERLADGELSFVALAEQMNGGTVAAKKRYYVASTPKTVRA